MKIKILSSLYIILLSVLLFGSSCQKNQNTIHGHVTYRSSITGNTTNANGASVTLYKSNGSKYDSQSAGSSGDYSFKGVKDGYYLVKADGNYNAIYYQASASSVVSGKANSTIDLAMN